MKTNYIKHVRIVYSLFAGILLICLGLFFSNIISSEDTPQVGGIASGDYNYGFTITNLNAGSTLYNAEHPIQNTPDGVTAHSHISHFDMDFYTRDESIRNDARINWIVALQIVQIACFIAVIILVVITLISFYRSAKRGHIFPEKKITLKEAMLFGMGTAAVAGVVYGLALWVIGINSASQTVLFTTTMTGNEVGLQDPQLHYWAAWWAIVAGIETILLGSFGAFLSAIFFRNEKGMIRNKNNN